MAWSSRPERASGAVPCAPAWLVLGLSLLSPAARAGDGSPPAAPTVQASPPETAPGPVAEEQPLQPEPRPARRGDEGLFTLRDGTTAVGLLVTSTDDGDIIQRADGSRLFLPARSVVSVVPVEDPEAPWAGLRPGETRLVLRDGRLVQGRIREQNGDGLRLATPAEEVSLPWRGIRDAYRQGGRRAVPRGLVDPARTRGLWAPTAFVLDHGEVAAGAGQFLAPVLALGVADIGTASVSTVPPVWYAGGLGQNVTLGGKLAARILPWLRAAGGVDAYLSSKGSLVAAFAAITAGSEDVHVTLAACPPPPAAERLGRYGARILAATAVWRPAARVAFLAEGWAGRDRRSQDRLGALGARLFGPGVAVDLGLAASSRGRLFPFLSLSATVRAP